MSIFSLRDRDRFEKLWRVYGRAPVTHDKLTELFDGSETTLHTHAGTGGGVFGSGDCDLDLDQGTITVPDAGSDIDLDGGSIA